MSNPGVIKLGNLELDTHKIWLDDNIGESIHIHIDNLRIDLTIKEFEQLCDELTKIFTKLVNKKNFNAQNFDARFMNANATRLLNIEFIKIEEVELELLRVQDDDGVVFLKDCARVKALNGKIDINETERRTSNFNTQTNKERLESCLNFVKEKGYPVDDNYIVVLNDKKIILDGWHRAACLCYLYGSIKVPVKLIQFKENIFNTSFYFPIEKVKPNSNVIIYGAGNVGKSYYKQLKQSKYVNIVAWVDKNYMQIKKINDYVIGNPDEIEHIEYDYILIAVYDTKLKKEIYDWLKKRGVMEEKVVD